MTVPIPTVQQISDLTNYSEEELVSLAKAGNSEAFNVLFNLFRPFALRVAQGILRNNAEAEEQVQEAFLKIYTHICGFL